jgi:enoyl-CoA hydratase/carnithine racemase
VKYRVEELIAVITVDRPPVNALNLQVQDEVGARLFRELFLTQGKKEGVAAFVEKRKPRFTGK